MRNNKTTDMKTVNPHYFEIVKLEVDGVKSWHLVTQWDDDPRTLCQGWVWWEDDDENVVNAPVKNINSFRQITCDDCRQIIKMIKSIK